MIGDEVTVTILGVKGNQVRLGISGASLGGRRHAHEGRRAPLLRVAGGRRRVRVKPSAADDEVLVRVHAASINPFDWHYVEGTPYLLRLDRGLGKPEDPRLGVDFAGTVEAVASVTESEPLKRTAARLLTGRPRRHACGDGWRSGPPA